MNREKTNHYRSFFLSFSLAFVALSLLFFLLLRTTRPVTSPHTTGVTADSMAAAAYLPVREDALTVLFVGVTPDSDGVGTFLLVRFDPAKGSVPIVAFPRETAVRNNGTTETLEQVYRYGGADYTRQRLAETIGIPIDRFVRMDTAAFIIAANTVGTMEFELEEELTLEREGASPLTLGAGMHLLDGKTVAELMQYGGYPGGEPNRCAMAGELTAAIVNQRMDIALSTMVDKVFVKIINLIDTDITAPDYENRKEAAAFLAKLGQDPAESIPVEGGYDAGGRVYRLSDTFIARLTQVYVS